uniref:F-box domain-containing protein n=1 Tax=Aureoumbra lagunensis TaxID=44058 RepID=A0A7S3K5X5_9STRA|mmetsp:Transcript_6909/g.9674  ORF Transcript_6909/g.9674 Transcript_6909/m.9674 type:complete len:555 (+) Transcript_6909:99-1763(+)
MLDEGRDEFLKYDQPVLLGFPRASDSPKKKKTTACLFEIGGSCSGCDAVSRQVESALFLSVDCGLPVVGDANSTGIVILKPSEKKCTEKVIKGDKEEIKVQIFTNYGNGPCVLGVDIKNGIEKISWLAQNKDETSSAVWILRRLCANANFVRLGDSFRLELAHVSGKKFLGICPRIRRVQIVSELRKAAIITIIEPSMHFIVTWKSRLALRLCQADKHTFVSSEKMSMNEKSRSHEGRSWPISLPTDISERIIGFLAPIANDDVSSTEERISWSSIDDIRRSYRRSNRCIMDIRNLRSVTKCLTTAAEKSIISIRINELDHLPRKSQRLSLISLAARCPRLVELKLRNLETLRDSDLDPLINAQLPLLQVLNLGGCIRLTDQVFDRLAHLSNLIVLNLAHTAVTPQALAYACAHFWPRLEDLNIYGKTDFLSPSSSYSEQKEDDLLQQQDALECFHISHLKAPEDVLLLILRSCPNLHSLNARDAGFSDQHVGLAISRLSSLCSTSTSSLNDIIDENRRSFTNVSILVDNRTDTNMQHYQNSSVYCSTLSSSCR